MKKFISILLILALCISIFSFSASAIQDESSLGIDISKYTDSELDLTQFTMEDILSMSPEEYSALIRKFERVYDPYGAYEEPNTSSHGISPLWESGDRDLVTKEWTRVGCHEHISAIACSILMNDKGFFYDPNPAAKVAASILISYASLLPDKDEKGIIPFAGHFYDPTTQKSFTGSTSNTARTNAAKHYDTAIKLSKKGVQVEDIYEELGRCLHYIQDASEPHHATNIRWPDKSHGEFEDYAAANIETYLGNYQTIPGSFYTQALKNSTGQLVNDAAAAAYPYAQYVNDTSNKTQWNSVASTCTKIAARHSAMVLYKFGKEPSVPFYSN